MRNGIGNVFNRTAAHLGLLSTVSYGYLIVFAKRVKNNWEFPVSGRVEIATSRRTVINICIVCVL